MYTASCDPKSEICTLNGAVNSQNSQADLDQDISIDFRFEKDRVFVSFRSDQVFYMLPNNGKYITIHLDANENEGLYREQTSLFVAHSLAKGDPEHSLVLRPHQGLLANVEVVVKKRGDKQSETKQSGKIPSSAEDGEVGL